MAMKDWECANKDCGHLQYQHGAFGRGCSNVKGRRAPKTKGPKDKGSAGTLCPCTRYTPPKGKIWH